MSVDASGFNMPVTTPAGEDPQAALIRKIVLEELAKSAKQTQGVGWVTGLDPLTIRLKSGGDVGASARDATLALVIGDRVSLLWAGDGYIVTGLATGPDEPQTTSGGVFPIGAVCLWPADQAVPDGWEHVTALNGKFVVAPDGATFISGTTGGTEDHDHTTPVHDHSISSGGGHTHGGVTGANNNNIDKTGGAGAAARDPHTHTISSDGGHDHGANTGNAGGAGTDTVSHLPPWSAEYIWIRRVT